MLSLYLLQTCYRTENFVLHRLRSSLIAQTSSTEPPHSSDISSNKKAFPGSERHACGLLGQERGTQRYQPIARVDEGELTAAVIALASQYGRYGYKKMAAMPQAAGWKVARGGQLFFGLRLANPLRASRETLSSSHADRLLTINGVMFTYPSSWQSKAGSRPN